MVQRNLKIVLLGISSQVVENNQVSRGSIETPVCPLNALRCPLLSFPLVCECLYVFCRQHDSGGVEIVALFCTRKDSFNTDNGTVHCSAGHVEVVGQDLLDAGPFPSN